MPSSPTQPTPSKEPSTLDLLQTHLARFQEQITRADGQRDLLIDQRNVAANAQLAAAVELEELDETLVAFSEVEQAWRRSGEERIMANISRGLTAVFVGHEIELKIVTRTMRDISVMEMHLVEDGVEIEDILNGTGASRVAVLDLMLDAYLITKLPLERIMARDEPFGAVSPEHLPALGQLLQELRDQLGFQFIIVSHEPQLQDAADVVAGVTPDGGLQILKSQNEERA